MFSGTNGASIWSQKLNENQKNRPITCLRCPQTKGVKFFATGDQSGRVRIWKGKLPFMLNKSWIMIFVEYDQKVMITQIFSNGLIDLNHV